MLTEKEYKAAVASFLIDDSFYCVKNNPDIEKFFETCAEQCSSNYDVKVLMDSLELFYRMMIQKTDDYKSELARRHDVLKNSLENPSEN